MDENIIILIPAFNEQKTIARIVDHCLQYVKYVLVIDDGSTDNTSQLVKNTRAQLHANAVNRGKGAALLKGFQLAMQNNCCGVITLDADGQHNPDDLPYFLKHSKKNPDTMIIGARRLSAHKAPKHRLLANKIADFFISCAARKRLYDTQSGYRYYPASFLMNYISRSSTANRFAFEADVLVAAVHAGILVNYVDIKSHYPIDARASHYRGFNDTWQIAKTVTRLMFCKKKKRER